MRRILWLAGVMGCGMTEVYEPSWLVELAVIAIEAEPPVLVPGGSLDVRVTAVSPTGTPLEGVLWACTLGEGGRCLEGAPGFGEGLPLSAWVHAGPIVDDHLSASFQVPISAEALSGSVDAEIALWAVACEEGACGLMEGIAADPPPSTHAYAEILDALSDVNGWLGGLPAGVAAGGVMRIPVGEQIENENPRVSGPDGPLRGPEGEAKLRVVDPVRDPRRFRVRGYSTVGPVQIRTPASDRVEVRWGPGSTEGGRVYVVVLDGLGGVGLWRGDVERSD